MQLATCGAPVAKSGTTQVKRRYTVTVTHHIINNKGGITESDSVLVYIPIVDYKAYIYFVFFLNINSKTSLNRHTIGLTLSGPFGVVVGLRS